MQKLFKNIIIVFTSLFFSQFNFAQSKDTPSNSVTSYTISKDSINQVKYISYYTSVTAGNKWITKQAECVFSKDSLMLFEKLLELHGKDTVTTKRIEKITMYGDLRNYKTLELLKGDKYLVSRFNAQGYRISKEKVLKSNLFDEWDRKIYTGKYALEKGK